VSPALRHGADMNEHNLIQRAVGYGTPRPQFENKTYD
jgi:hypothetical protein